VPRQGQACSQFERTGRHTAGKAQGMPETRLCRWQLGRQRSRARRGHAAVRRALEQHAERAVELGLPPALGLSLHALERISQNGERLGQFCRHHIGFGECCPPRRTAIFGASLLGERCRFDHGVDAGLELAFLQVADTQQHLENLPAQDEAVLRAQAQPELDLLSAAFAA